MSGARNFPGIFCKFCEPLEKVRARFSEKKTLPKKRTGPPKTKERSAGNCTTLQSASKRAQVNLFDIFDAAQVGRQSEGSIAVEVEFAFADELNHDARQSTYEVVIAGICVCEKGKGRVQRERGNVQEISPSSASHSREFAQNSDRKNFFKNCALGRNLRKERSSKQHPPVIFEQYLKSTLVSCMQFPSTWMSPVWNRIDKQAGQV